MGLRKSHFVALFEMTTQSCSTTRVRLLGPTASSAAAAATCPHVTVISSPPLIVSSYLSILLGKIGRLADAVSNPQAYLIDRPCMASLGMLTINATPHVSRGSRRRPDITVSRPRSYVLCQSRLPTEPPVSGGGGGGGGKKGRPWWAATAERLRGDVVKAGMAARESLSPKQKGDWKDVTLMSFSFAVYVYISQKLVCTYCAWISMINH
ncbi:hypothetical protein BAE44_0016569 [Dichanthelium oligosanthes]|uniref:Uncharacterized protein n=1 Tax=Dichanthelium oligosanthes TaxID=888268 RepID=A0A1E5VBM2_9POAL|nr:hypothetical protein BAE44_0016569 [Dichanthelium oligosanthes]